MNLSSLQWILWSPFWNSSECQPRCWPWFLLMVCRRSDGREREFGTIGVLHERVLRMRYRSKKSSISWQYPSFLGMVLGSFFVIDHCRALPWPKRVSFLCLTKLKRDKCSTGQIFNGVCFLAQRFLPELFLWLPQTEYPQRGYMDSPPKNRQTSNSCFANILFRMMYSPWW